MSDAESGETKRGFFSRLAAGLKRSANSLTEGVVAIFTKRKLDQAALDELEELLIRSDLGVGPAGEIVAELKRQRFEKEVSPEDVRTALAEIIAARLAPVEAPLTVGAAKPHVVLVVGVNGSGKTTTIGKIARRLRAEGKSVMLAAGDTFRAAAIEQLQIWGQRIGAPVISAAAGSDSASLAFEALTAARRDGADVLLIDTAGRLQNKADLMAELAKVLRVMKKIDAEVPHTVLLVLDGTVGQNALQQVEVFRDVAGVSGLVITKLDGTARAGVVVAIAAKFGLPVHLIGVGESADDLQDFSASGFARALVGAAHE